jgi:HlyD family secretion protein
LVVLVRLTRLAITNIALIAVAAAGGAFAYTSLGQPVAAHPRTAAQRTATIASGTVVTSISSSGNVTAPQNLDINFGASGKITQISVSVGQHVTQGQQLARLDPAAAQAALDTAKAQLAAAQAKLANPSGTTPLDTSGMAISEQQAQQQVNAAQTALSNAQQNLSLDQTTQAAALAQAQQQLATDQTAQAAALAQAEQQLAADQTTYDQDSSNLAQSVDQAKKQAATQLGIDSAQLSADQATKTADCAAVPTDPTDPGYQAAVAKCDHDAVAVLSDQAKVAADGTATDNYATATLVLQAQNTLQQTLTKDQAAVNRDQDAITNAQNAQAANLAKDNQAIKNAQNAQAATVVKDNQAIKNAQQQVTNAQLSLQSLKNSNAQKTAAPLPADVESNQAAVEQAQVQVTNAQAALDATTLTAPADGTIGAINASVGDTVTAGTTSTSAASSSGGAGGGGSGSNASSGFITLTNLTDLQVVANIDEADAAKVAVNAPATVTLNALPTKTFAAHVIAVADTSTVSSNVVQYPVTLSLDNSNSTVKPGMTANVTITTAKVDGVLNVESAAVRSAGGTSYVMVLQPDGTQKQVDVVVGLKGDTSTEISGAVKAGELAALPASTTPTSSTSQSTQTSNNRGGLPRGVGGGLGGGFGGFGGGRG